MTDELNHPAEAATTGTNPPTFALVTAIGQPRCQAVNRRGRRAGQQCSRRATAVGGRCGLHGGHLMVCPSETASRFPELQARYEHYRRQTTVELFDLREMAAEFRAIADWSAGLGTGDQTVYLKLRVATLLHALEGLERIARVEEKARHADARLRAEAEQLQKGLVDALEQAFVSFVPQERWEQAFAAIRNLFLGQSHSGPRTS